MGSSIRVTAPDGWSLDGYRAEPKGAGWRVDGLKTRSVSVLYTEDTADLKVGS
jgi:hypothetical protein